MLDFGISNLSYLLVIILKYYYHLLNPINRFYINLKVVTDSYQSKISNYFLYHFNVFPLHSTTSINID